MQSTTDLMNEVNLNQQFNISNPDIDEILRGEISAKEAYSQVMDTVKDDPESFRLRQFYLDHDSAVQYWKREARLMGNLPENSSSIWGKAAEAFVGVSKLLGESVALNSLLRGEEHGLANYEKMLESTLLTMSQKREIKESFIPRQSRHIESIKAMIKMR